MEYMVIDNGTSILAMSTKDGARWLAKDGHKWDESTKAAYSCAQRFKSKIQAVAYARKIAKMAAQKSVVKVVDLNAAQEKSSDVVRFDLLVDMQGKFFYLDSMAPWDCRDLQDKRGMWSIDRFDRLIESRGAFVVACFTLVFILLLGVVLFYT